MKKIHTMNIEVISIIIISYMLIKNNELRETIFALGNSPIKTNLTQLQDMCTSYTIIGKCPNGDYIQYDIAHPEELLTSIPDVYDQNGNSLIYSASRNTLCCTESKSYLYTLRKIQGKEVGCAPEKSKNLCN